MKKVTISQNSLTAKKIIIGADQKNNKNPASVDCIDMIAAPPLAHKKDPFRNRFLAREKRLAKSKKETVNIHDDKRAYIEKALLRVKLKKQR